MNSSKKKFFFSLLGVNFNKIILHPSKANTFFLT